MSQHGSQWQKVIFKVELAVPQELHTRLMQQVKERGMTLDALCSDLVQIGESDLRKNAPVLEDGLRRKSDGPGMIVNSVTRRRG